MDALAGQIGKSDGQSHRTMIVGLDLLRFLAALLVVLFHLAFWVRIDGQVTARAAGGVIVVPGTTLFQPGWIGVEVFFVLSGIVIGYSAAGQSLRRFVRSRVGRLLPALWLCAALTLAIGATGPAYGQESLLAIAVRSFVLLPLGGTWADPVYWTLVVEIAFYAVVAASIATGRFGKARWIAYGLAVASLAFWGIMLTTGQFGHHGSAASARIWALLLLRHGGFFALGMIIWLWFLEGERSRTMLFFAVVAGTACIGEIVSTHRVYEDLTRLPSSVAIPMAIWGISVAAMIASIVWNRPIAAALAGSHGMIRRLGVATYPLYLVHNVAGATILGHLRRLGAGDGFAIAAGVVASLTLAFLAIRLEPLLARYVLLSFDAVGRPRRPAR